MNKPNLPWWSSMGLLKDEPAPDTDYAGMGTAFGLDASIGPVDEVQSRPGGDEARMIARLNGRSVI